MNITEQLINICNPIDDNLFFTINNLSAEQRSQLEVIIMKLYKFQRIEWVSLPAFEVPGTSTIMQAERHKIFDDDRPVLEYNHEYVGYIYSVAFSPKIYAVDNVKYVPTQVAYMKAATYPNMFHIDSFIPKAEIRLQFYEEQKRDMGIMSNKTKLEQLNDTLVAIRDVIEYPERYEGSYTRDCMIRFAAYNVNNNNQVEEIETENKLV